MTQLDLPVLSFALTMPTSSLVRRRPHTAQGTWRRTLRERWTRRRRTGTWTQSWMGSGRPRLRSTRA
eukprot:1634970-Rhodomonas_salina.1